ncbi:MAG: glycoside hydrolase family 3 C-terminal domain-containing protein, partial [Bacteroidales bacterium]|nr:glycoside hydrolase family 3 C-terminal domain-containing protein [Bacteroidales bacterium]
IGPTLFYPGAGASGVLKMDFNSAISPYEGVVSFVSDNIFLYTSTGVNMRNDVAPLDTSIVYIGQGVNGFSAKYYNNLKASGTPAKFATDKQIDFNWGTNVPCPEIDSTAFSVQWDATLIPQHGPVKVKLIHNDGCRLYLDGKLIIDAWKPGPFRMDSAWLNIEKGMSYNLRIDYFSDGGSAMIRFGFDYLMDLMIAGAVEKAKRADVAIVFIGQPVSDGNARQYCNIPNQSRLIRAVYEANPNTIVVLQTVSAVDIEDWAFDIPTIIQAWTPKQESGTAIAEVLFGQINPDGKLPFTWAMNENQNFDSRFPFGHGLSYTTFGIGKLMMNRSRDGSGWTATVEIRNVGDRAGTETLQLYVRNPESDAGVAEKDLKAFKMVTLFPGQKKTVAISVPYSSFEYYDVESSSRTIDPGKYKILIGTSAEDIKLIKTIVLRQEHIDQYYDQN